MKKLMEDDIFRKELAQSTAMRCQRKQPLGSRREQELLPARTLEHREEDGGSFWADGSLVGQAAFEEVEELEDESKELEELAAGPDTAVPKFEGERSVCVVSKGAMGKLCWGECYFLGSPGDLWSVGSRFNGAGSPWAASGFVPPLGCLRPCARC